MCYAGGGEQGDVAVSYESSGSAGDVEAEDGRMSKSGRLRRQRRSSRRRSSVASYQSVDARPRRSDPSLRCVSVSSTAEGFVIRRKFFLACALHAKPGDSLLLSQMQGWQTAGEFRIWTIVHNM